MTDDNNNRLLQKQDVANLAILIGIALAIGVYLIVTTVLISKDGVFYIERAQQLTTDPVRIIKTHPPGYPFLIMTAKKCTALFTDDTSVFTWIYAAQSVTLLCRLLALVPLYLIGKLLVGSKNSFLALLILIFLPFPTRTACEVVRGWPYLLFLATGFFFLLWSAKSGKWQLFGLVGLISGLGYLLRPETAQLVIYGLLWGVVSLFRPKLWGVRRWKSTAAMALLLVGFAIPAAPYMKYTDRVVPDKLNNIMKSFSFNALPDKAETLKENANSSNYNTAEIISYSVLKALGEIFKTIGENLIWFFVPMLFIGIWYHFRHGSKYEERFLIITFIMMNIVMMLLRYAYILLHVSQRWSLPLIVFTIFYVPVGLRTVGDWLDNKWSPFKPKTDIPKDKRLSWFVILFLIGIGICMPKLFRPVGIEKQGYREAASWLRQNTDIEDMIAFPYKRTRITFYAERKGLAYRNKLPKQVAYVVRIIGDEDEEIEIGIEMQKRTSMWVDKKRKKKRIVIYEVLH